MGEQSGQEGQGTTGELGGCAASAPGLGRGTVRMSILPLSGSGSTREAKKRVREEARSDCWLSPAPGPRAAPPPSAVPPDAPHADADDGLGVQQRLAVRLHQLQRLVLQLEQQVLSLQRPRRQTLSAAPLASGLISATCSSGTCALVPD